MLVVRAEAAVLATHTDDASDLGHNLLVRTQQSRARASTRMEGAGDRDKAGATRMEGGRYQRDGPRAGARRRPLSLPPVVL